MKKALIVGKFNPTVEQVKNIVSKVCHAQTTLDNINIINGILKQNKPELVVLVFEAIQNNLEEIVKILQKEHPDITVLCIGTENDRKKMEQYFITKQFFFLARPFTPEQLSATICEALDVSLSVAAHVMASSDSKKVIMLVDDSPAMLRTLSNILSKDFEVILATSAMQAMMILGSRKPDMIFLDYEMPVCDGQMTLRMIREVDDIKDIPVVFLTGVKDKDHISAVMYLNPAGYLLKPAPVEKILETIKLVLGL